MASIFSDGTRIRRNKKTRQGMGRGTKWGTKPSTKAGKKARNRYKKKYRGQGGKR
jgi:hypothetical protein|tara:strand:- start:767 stop:931 length:165 start_codon:yes stop_codon:yes gene_type:complete